MKENWNKTTNDDDDEKTQSLNSNKNMFKNWYNFLCDRDIIVGICGMWDQKKCVRKWARQKWNDDKTLGPEKN